MIRYWFGCFPLFLVLSTTWAQTGGARGEITGSKFAPDYRWLARPTNDLSTPGNKTVNLSSCPNGVKGSEPEYWIYISGTGTEEAVRVTGGSCAGDGNPGTLQFGTIKPHSAGYTISSATGGIQEASIGARITPTNPKGTPQAGKVIVPPGEYDIYGPVSIRSDDQAVDFTGSILNCYVNDPCIKVPRNTSSVTLVNPRGRPMVVNGTQPFIEINGQNTRVFNVLTRISQSGGTFGSYIQVDDDQAFLLDGLDTSVGGMDTLRCDARFCGALVKAPGPFNTWSAVGWLKHLNISANCHGNGVDWQSGNTLHISDSVIQGYAQYGIRGGIARGGYGNIKLDNIYMEVGNCSNPIPGLGIAGIIAQGGRVQIDGGEGPQGKVVQFSNTGNTRYEYFIVARNASHASAPLYIGYALTNKSGKITVTSPDIQTQTPASSYDLLRTTWNEGPPYTVTPWGTGNWAVVTNVARAEACIGGVCTFIDTNAQLRSYTVTDPPTFGPILSAWSGDIVLGYGSTLSMRNTKGSGGYVIVSTNGSSKVSVVSDNCSPTQLWQPLWVACPLAMHEGNFLGPGPVNTPNYYNLKGRVNFGEPKGIPSHVITLRDSNPSKTIAWANNRPPSDANDAYIGYDAGIADYIGISFGAPGSISNYIGSVGDGKNWRERLTAKEKTFAVPVTIKNGNTFTVGSGSALSEIKIYTTNDIQRAAVPAQTCLDLMATVSGLSGADQITGITPPAPLGNLSLNAYPKGANTLTLHFCNPSTSSVNVPSGAYSFLAVH
jgi:hypothetical protein